MMLICIYLYLHAEMYNKYIINWKQQFAASELSSLFKPHPAVAYM